MKKIINPMALMFGLIISTVAFAGKGAQDVKVLDGGYVRSTPPGHTVTGAFFDLENKGDVTHTITGVESPLAPQVEMHRTVTQGKDMMQMKPIQKLEIGAHQTITLRPAGDHIMLMNLTKPLGVGDTVKLTLIFEDGSKLPVKLLVHDARD